MRMGIMARAALPRARRRGAAFLAVALCWRPAPAQAQVRADVERAVRRVADAVLANASFTFVDSATGLRYAAPGDAPEGARLRPASAYNDWRYWNGVLDLGLLRLAEVLHEPRYAALARRNVAFAFDTYPFFERRYRGESKWEYPFGQRIVREELDDYGAMGASVIEVYAHDRDARYRRYLQDAADYATTRQNRLPDGTFVRGFPRRWTLWADDLYMSVAFLSRMARLAGEGRYLDDAARQVVNFQHYLFDDRAQLMYHDWYSDTERPGVAFWGRANGWALLAQVDLLDRLPRGHPRRDTLLVLLRRHLEGVVARQDTSGLWHQLLDREDSYLETSASAMFTYALARAVNRGYVGRRFAAAARRGWAGVASRIRDDGRIEGTCAGTGVSDSLSDYYRRPTPLNDVHGIGAVLLAGSEVLRLSR
jgi:unsaturated rhamnogalacturonyl hydrolase